MMKSYVAKTTINFVDFEFYVRPGDVLVHDTHNQNRLTVYRNGQIVKVVKQDPLGIVAFLKNRFIEEVSTPAPEPKAIYRHAQLPDGTKLTVKEIDTGVVFVNPVGVTRLTVSRDPEPTPTATEAPEVKQEPKKAKRKAAEDYQTPAETVEKAEETNS